MAEERYRAQAKRAIADTSRWDVPTELRDEDAEAALATMESEGLIVVRAADYRGAVEALRLAEHRIIHGGDALAAIQDGLAPHRTGGR